MLVRFAVLVWLVLLLFAVVAQGRVLRSRRALGRPAIALRRWVALLIASAVLLVIPGCALLVQGAVTANRGWITFVTMSGGWVLLVAAGGIIAAVLAAADRLNDSAGRQRADLEDGAGPAVSRHGHVLRECAGAAPLAVALRGRPATIIVSSGLLATLSEEQLDAVLAHELAHLRRGHGRLVRIAEVLDAIIPRRWRDAPSAPGRPVRLLVELVADDDAAAAVGAGSLDAALGALHAATGEAGYAARRARLRALAQPQTR